MSVVAVHIWLRDYLFIYLFIVWSDDNLVEKYFQEEKFSFVCVSVYFLKVLHHLMASLMAQCWEEGSGWGTHVYLWRIHFDIWQN